MSQIGENKIPNVAKAEFYAEVEAAYDQWANFATAMLVHDDKWPEEIRKKVNSVAYWLGQLDDLRKRDI